MMDEAIFNTIFLVFQEYAVRAYRLDSAVLIIKTSQIHRVADFKRYYYTEATRKHWARDLKRYCRILAVESCFWSKKGLFGSC